jgi:hypothetical protein
MECLEQAWKGGKTDAIWRRESKDDVPDVYKSVLCRIGGGNICFKCRKDLSFGKGGTVG